MTKSTAKASTPNQPPSDLDRERIEWRMQRSVAQILSRDSKASNQHMRGHINKMIDGEDVKIDLANVQKAMDIFVDNIDLIAAASVHIALRTTDEPGSKGEIEANKMRQFIMNKLITKDVSEDLVRAKLQLMNTESLIEMVKGLPEVQQQMTMFTQYAADHPEDRAKLVEWMKKYEAGE